jgi:hypothetical protein
MKKNGLKEKEKSIVMKELHLADCIDAMAEAKDALSEFLNVGDETP